MFLIRGVFHALAAPLSPVYPWDNAAQWRAPVTHAIAVNIVHLIIVVGLMGGIVRLLERLF